MGTSRDTIRGWLDRGKREGATHVMPGEDVHKVHSKYSGKDMQRVMEVYALHLDFESQLKEIRAFHFQTLPLAAGFVPKGKRRQVVSPPEPIAGGLKLGAVLDLKRALHTVVTVRSVTMRTPEAVHLEPRYQAVREAFQKLISEVGRMTPKPDPEREAEASVEDDLDELDGEDV